jgi:hypothetical protein
MVTEVFGFHMDETSVLEWDERRYGLGPGGREEAEGNQKGRDGAVCGHDIPPLGRRRVGPGTGLLLHSTRNWGAKRLSSYLRPRSTPRICSPYSSIFFGPIP